MSLDSFDELEFVYQLNLRNFYKKSGGFNFSCPICGEGSSPHKHRAWILYPSPKHDHNTFMCHNCLPEGMSLRRFISIVDPYVYEKYREAEKKQYINDVKNGKLFQKKNDINRNTQQLTEIPKYVFTLSRQTFIPCKTNFAAYEYCKERKIPESVIDKMMYCPRKELSFGGMIIFPFYFDDERVFGFQGRAIKEKRFHTFMTNEDFKVYNYFQVDKKKPVYVFESIIDSFVMPNSIAMLGADLTNNIREQLKQPVFVFDNDRTGEEKALKYIRRGEKCFIWPDGLKAKDFGDLRKKNIPDEHLQKLIKSRTFSGLKGEIEAKLKLTKSKKTFRRIKSGNL